MQLKANTPQNETESVLSANYNNYGAKYKIVAYNYGNYNGNMSGLLQADGSLNTAIGTDIPANTATVTFKPKPMASVGHGGSGDNVTGTIGHHTFTTSKQTGVANKEITYKFQMDNASWQNGSGTLNQEMQSKFDPNYQSGNVIVTLWKNEGGTNDFTLVDSYNGGTIDTLQDTEDGIVSVQPVTTDGVTNLIVKVQAGTNSNIHGTQYRVFAWYVSSNGDGTYTTANMNDIAEFGGANPNVHGIIPYATSTINLDFQDPTFYIQIPDLITLHDDRGNVKESGTGADGSSQYAGAAAQITYKASDTGVIPDPGLGTVPEIQVDLTDNMPMTAEGATAPSDKHFVGVYFADGFKNVTESTVNSGMVTLGTLSATRTASADSNLGENTQTTPIGTSLPFYLNTLQGNNGEKYTVQLSFHFNILSSTP